MMARSGWKWENKSKACCRPQGGDDEALFFHSYYLEGYVLNALRGAGCGA